MCYVVLFTPTFDLFFSYAILKNEELLRMSYLVFKNSDILPQNPIIEKVLMVQTHQTQSPLVIQLFLKGKCSTRNVKKVIKKFLEFSLRPVDVVYTLR